MSIEVLKPGALTTVQDLGRWGQQRLGIVVGGAMDDWSHRIANALVGNPDEAATLEITMVGPTLGFTVDSTVALLGADLSPTIAGRSVPLGQAVRVRAGARLEFGARVCGMRTYLAVGGGIATPPVMGSRSTYLRGAFGGHDGRALRKGDVLQVGAASRVAGPVDGDRPYARLPTPRVMSASLRDEHAVITLRIVPGAHWDLFTDEAQQACLATPYRIALQSDRMGYRLEGAPLARRRAFEMISEGVAYGTMQVPPDGQPIVLMADRQSTGGYPKIANVASVDLPVLAQLGPHRMLRFEAISLAAAQALAVRREHGIAALRERLQPTTETAPA
ncbi:MAG: biotin-dependent carboxyltransferase family protein [Proteobacteria bacterium]|nr:biotin-dependent carboxyltransferase family protein [Pseudomonadota bacterium]